jgi:FkbM family methyltransferase
MPHPCGSAGSLPLDKSRDNDAIGAKMDDTLITLTRHVGLTALDVGARGGVNEDLTPLASSTDYVGFEPDAEECARLQRAGSSSWRSVKFVPVALAAEEGEFPLNLYSKRGCSSKYTALKESGGLFARGDFYNLDKVVQVPCQRLDDVLEKEGIVEPAFMKIDVQGMEVEVFDGAPLTLKDDLAGIRTEVSFFPIYQDQPLFAEVDQRLRGDGFVPMRWMESHEWRRATKRKPSSLDKGQVPFSRGQLMHADVLYLLHPENLGTGSPKELRRLCRLGLISAAYGHYDHAIAAFAIPAVLEFCRDEPKVDPVAAVRRMSAAKATLGRRMGGRLLRYLQSRLE